MPDELLLLLEKVEKDGKAQPNNALVYVSSPPSLHPLTFPIVPIAQRQPLLEAEPHCKVHLLLWEALTHPYPPPVLRQTATPNSLSRHRVVHCHSKLAACCLQGPTFLTIL